MLDRGKSELSRAFHSSAHIHLAIGVQDVNGPRIYELIGWIENNIVNFNRGGAFPHYGRGYGDYNWMKVADEDDIWRWERDIRWAIDDFAGCPYAAGDSNTFVGLVFSYVGFTPTSEQTAAWGWTPGNNVAAGNLPCRK